MERRQRVGQTGFVCFQRSLASASGRVLSNKSTRSTKQKLIILIPSDWLHRLWPLVAYTVYYIVPRVLYIY